MSVLVSVLRGINVSGHNKVPMKDLKALYEELGFTEVQTYIQSGNVIFRAGKETASAIARRLEEAIEAHFGFMVPVLVRSLREMKHILEHNPFLKEQDIDTSKLHVTLLEDKPAASLAEGIKDLDYSPDRFVLSGTEVYLYCPVSYGNTKLNNTFFERKLKQKATTRNWKTMQELLSRMQSYE